MRLKMPFAAIIAAILMVSQAANAGELFPKVLVSVPVLKPYVDEIMRGQGASESLLRAGQDPHSFALAPSQARALDEADIIIVPDLGMSPFLKRQVESKKTLKVIELRALPGADPLPYATENPWLTAVKEAGDEDEHEHDKKPKRAPKPSKKPAPSPNDPHLWLDPERMAAIAEPLAQAMAEAAPEAREALTANARTLATHLRREVIPNLQTLLKPKDRATVELTKPEISFITYHAAYQYFMARFGIARQGEILTRPEDYLGAQTLDTLLTRAKTLRIRCIITEQEGPLVHRLAQYSGAKIITLSPEQNVTRKDVDALDWLQNDYDRLLYKTAKSFGGCL